MHPAAPVSEKVLIKKSIEQGDFSSCEKQDVFMHHFPM